MAVGVRCMKLNNGDFIDEVHYSNDYDENTFERGGKKMPVNSLKLSKRDGKGTKLK